MKRNLILVLCMAAVLGVLGWSVSRAARCETFAGSEFHARSEADCRVVFSDLEGFVREKGFAPAHSPSAMDAWVGVQGEDMRRIWYEGSTRETKGLHLSIDLTPTHIRTNVRWGVNGFEKDARDAKLRALQMAVVVDDWIASRAEGNNLPDVQRQQKHRWYGDEIAKLSR